MTVPRDQLVAWLAEEGEASAQARSGGRAGAAVAPCMLLLFTFLPPTLDPAGSAGVGGPGRGFGPRGPGRGGYAPGYGPGGRGFPGGGGPGGLGGGGPQQGPQCFSCGGFGHISRNCPRQGKGGPGGPGSRGFGGVSGHSFGGRLASGGSRPGSHPPTPQAHRGPDLRDDLGGYNEAGLLRRAAAGGVASNPEIAGRMKWTEAETEAAAGSADAPAAEGKTIHITLDGRPVATVAPSGETRLFTRDPVGGNDPSADELKDQFEALGVVLRSFGARLSMSGSADGGPTTWTVTVGKGLRPFSEGMVVAPTATSGTGRGRALIKALENPLIAAAQAASAAAAAAGGAASGGWGFGGRGGTAGHGGRGRGRGWVNDEQRRLQAQGRFRPY